MTESPRSPAPKRNPERTNAPRSLYALALALLPLMVGARSCERVPVGTECDGGPCAQSDAAQQGCLYGGVQRAVGESFPSEDGCNTCSCADDGQVACTLRACATETCGGLAGLRCGPDKYCKFAPEAQCGAADQTGVCTPKGQVCPTIYAPVCGCDDKTYGNECEAGVNGVSVASRGECAGNQPGGDTCGGLLGKPCATGQFCDYPPDARCGAADATGVCRAIPQACTLEYSPVCGCDDKTYGNRCDAASHGVSVASSGECGATGPTGASCGSRGQAPCASGEYCNFAPDADCGKADAPGTCTPIPQACTREYNPVCGCDGQTYANPCTAASAGVSVAAAGECGGGTGSGDTCGGIAGRGCPAGEYCNYPQEAQCGAADQTGTCTTIPSGCREIYQPVCGCDDKTYGNACEAAAASVSVAKQGECDGGGSGTFCGGLIGAQCATGEYCNYPAGANCGRADASGTCARKPQVCDAIYDPVCGCDGMTYSSACVAASKGVSVESNDACN